VHRGPPWGAESSITQDCDQGRDQGVVAPSVRPVDELSRDRATTSRGLEAGPFVRGLECFSAEKNVLLDAELVIVIFYFVLKWTIESFMRYHNPYFYLLLTIY
jgi:hypothetical protein